MSCEHRSNGSNSPFEYGMPPHVQRNMLQLRQKLIPGICGNGTSFVPQGIHAALFICMSPDKVFVRLSLGQLLTQPYK